MYELLAAEAEHPVEVSELEEDVEHRVVGAPQLVLALVQEVLQHGAVELDPYLGELMAGELDRRLAVAALIQRVADGAFDQLCQRGDHLGETAEKRVVAVAEDGQRGLEGRRGEDRGVVLPTALDQVVGLIDDQDRALQCSTAEQAREPDDRVEDVVVVADHDVDVRQQVERDLERAHLVLACRVEDPIRVEVAAGVEQRRQQLGANQLDAVLACVRAKLLVADHLRVRAHLAFGAQLEAAEPAALHRPYGFDCEPLLERLGGQVEQPVPVEQRPTQGGVERRRSLSGSGWRGEEQMALLAQSGVNCCAHRKLCRPWLGVGKRQVGGLGAQPIQPLEPTLFDRDQSPNRLAQPRIDRVAVPDDLLVALLEGDDVNQHQPRRGGRAVAGEHGGVEAELAPEAVEAFGGVEIVQVDGEVESLDLVDPDHTVPAPDHSVGATHDGDPPTVDDGLQAHRNLGLVTGLEGGELLLNTAVELLADPQARETGPVEADRALSGLAGEVAHAGSERARLEVNQNRHGAILGAFETPGPVLTVRIATSLARGGWQARCNLTRPIS